MKKTNNLLKETDSPPITPTVLGQSPTSTIFNRKRAEVSIRVRQPVVIFYVGGAGDKKKFVPLPASAAGPFRNILDAQLLVNKNTAHLKAAGLILDYWRGYYEIYGDEDIKKNVLPYIPDKNTPIIIIGHSLGGWNGAHLSQILGNKGYNIEMLVTIDPVGESALVSASDIYSDTPHVIAKYWINILADANDGNFTDFIAYCGGRWKIKSGPTINATVDTNHAEAGIMFRTKIHENKSASDIVTEKIKQLTL